MYTDKKSLGHQLTTRLYDSMCITNYHLTKNIYHSAFLYIYFTALHLLPQTFPGHVAL